MKAPDGEYQDAYVLGIEEPVKTFVDQLIAVIIRKNDDEDKLVVAAKDRQYSKEEIRQAVNFQEQHFKSKIIIPGERREWDDE